MVCVIFYVALAFNIYEKCCPLFGAGHDAAALLSPHFVAMGVPNAGVSMCICVSACVCMGLSVAIGSLN